MTPLFQAVAILAAGWIVAVWLYILVMLAADAVERVVEWWRDRT
jgi:hypothetical protein